MEGDGKCGNGSAAIRESGWNILIIRFERQIGALMASGHYRGDRRGTQPQHPYINLHKAMKNFKTISPKILEIGYFRIFQASNEIRKKL